MCVFCKLFDVFLNVSSILNLGICIFKNVEYTSDFNFNVRIVRARVCASKLNCVRARMCVSVNAYYNTSVCTHVCAHVCICASACVCVCVCVCARASVCVRVNDYM